MPNRPPAPCREPGCPALLAKPGRCPKHQREYNRELRERRGGNAYGRQWQRIRAQVLAEEPICRCGARATEVHHIVALSRHGTNARSNLVSLCKPCHSRITAGESFDR